jgi:hypothetical protein
MIEECRETHLQTLNLNDPTVNSITTGLSTVKFANGNLNPGSKYCINLIITDSSSRTGQVTTEIYVPRVPSSGTCSLATSAVKPIEFQTTVTITCRAWVTDPTSFPLEYSWGLLNDQGVWKTVAYTGASSIFSTSAFPDGNYTMGVLIRDQLGSVNIQQFNFRVDFVQASGDTRTSYFESLVANYAYHKDLLSTLTTVCLIASSLGISDTALASSIVDFVSTMIFDDGLFASYPLAESILGVLDAASQVTLDATRSRMVLKIQNEVLSAAAQSVVNSQIHWFSETFVRKSIEVSDRIILSMNSRSYDLSACLELVVSTRQLLSENYLINRACGEGDGGIKHTSSVGSYALYHSYQKSDIFCEEISVSNLQLNTCRLYSCGKLYVSNIATTINPYLYAIHFFSLDQGESNNNTRIKTKQEMDSSSQLLTVEIKIDSDFAIANSILESTSQNSISCVKFNQTGEWTSDSCALVSINTASASCVCRYDASGFIGLASSATKVTSGVVITTNSDAAAANILTIALVILFAVFGLIVLGYFCYIYKIPILAAVAKIRCPDMSRCFGGKKRRRRVFPMLPTIDENGQLKLEPVDLDDEFSEVVVHDKHEGAVVVIEGNDDVVDVVDVQDDGEFEVYSIEKEKSASRDVQWPIRI